MQVKLSRDKVMSYFRFYLDIHGQISCYKLSTINRKTEHLLCIYTFSWGIDLARALPALAAMFGSLAVQGHSALD